jgi:hypothetical protein
MLVSESEIHIRASSRAMASPPCKVTFVTSAVQLTSHISFPISYGLLRFGRSATWPVLFTNLSQTIVLLLSFTLRR